ncbi:MAG: hypothetical protein MJZ92_03250, partial [Paludibacteraceae bacterium]|nr:hypothetical protein [Paludibacteraceae bacterium]
MTKKLFTLLTALVLSIGIGWAQMQRANRNPLADKSLSIAKQGHKLHHVKPMKDLSFGEIDDDEVTKNLPKRAPQALQAETIHVDLGHCIFNGTWGSLRSKTYWEFEKDNRVYYLYTGWVGDYGTSWTSGTFNTTQYAELYSYELGDYIEVSSASTRVNFDIDDHYTADVYITASNGIVYHFSMVYDSNFDIDSSSSDNCDKHYNSVTTHEVWGTGDIGIVAQTNKSSKVCFEFWTDPTISTTIVPTGTYTISDSGQPWTVTRSEGYDGSSIYRSYVITLNNSNGITTPAWFFDQGEVYVINPNNSTNPYIYVSATNSQGAAINVTVGTEPTHRIVNIQYDGYIGDCSVDASTELPCIDDNCTQFWQGTIISLTPVVASDEYEFKGWTGTGASDIVANGDGTYTLTIGAKDYDIAATFAKKSTTPIVTINTPTNGTIVV